MTNVVAKIDTNQFAGLDAAIGGDLDGDLFRFKGGKFFRGSEKEEVPLKRDLRFAPLSVQDGWQKWIDGRIVDQRFREWISAQPQINRDDLGDLDNSRWPEGKDPWSFALIAALKDAKGTQLKFVTGSTGGINAVRRMLRLWRQDRDRHPDLVPVVRLGVDKYQHKALHTEIVVPVFTIVGWAPWDGEMPKVPSTPKALPPGGVTADDPRTMMGRSVAVELNDDIPFAPEWRA